MIPDRFHDLPVHPLAVHASVVLVPLAALLAILFVVPRTRAWAAIPMPLVAVGALLSVFVSRESGENLKADLGIGDAIQTHQDKADALFVLMIVFAVIAVAVYVVYRQTDRFTGAVQYAACTVLVVGALVVAYQTYQVGESGSKVVWGGQSSSSSSAPLVMSVTP